MVISHLEFHKSPILFAYGMRYHAFTFPGNEAVIYYPELSKVMFRKRFNLEYQFTSLIMRQGECSCDVVLIGLSNGQVLKIESRCDSHILDSNVKFTSEIGSPRDVWQDENLSQHPSQEVMITRSQRKPIKVWGANLDDMFYSREEKIASRDIDRIYIHGRDGSQTSVSLSGSVELAKLAGNDCGLTVLIRRPSGFVVVELLDRLDEHQSYRFDVPSYWTPVALSSAGEVAFMDNGHFHFLGPRLPRSQPITLGNSKRNRISGQSCFFGKGDEYFAYCGAQRSEIAIAAIDSNHIWKERTSMQFETAYLFKTQAGYSDIHDPGTDGLRLIVRLASAQNDCGDGSDDDNATVHHQHSTATLWHFFVDQSGTLKLEKRMNTVASTIGFRDLH